MEIRGRLFDLYPLESSMILWIKEEDGSAPPVRRSFPASILCTGEEKRSFRSSSTLSRKGGGPQDTSGPERRSSGVASEVEVMEIEVVDAEHYAQLPRILPQWEEKITFYNCDIPLPQTYLYEKKIFPTGRCIVEVEGNRIFKIHPDPSESVWMDDGDIPDLRVMELRTDGNSVPLAGRPGRRSGLFLECEGYRLEMEDDRSWRDREISQTFRS